MKRVDVPRGDIFRAHAGDLRHCLTHRTAEQARAGCKRLPDTYHSSV